MRILHILDHSLPLHSGYVFRTLGILKAQRDRGWETHHLTTPKHIAEVSGLKEEVDGWEFHRTPGPTGFGSGVPVLRERAQMRCTESRLRELCRELKPDVLHAHSPVLNAIPAMRVGKDLGIPVLYEVRALWEDAAVDHGTTTEGSLRYRLTRGLETKIARKAEALTMICEGLKKDFVSRGISAEKITIIPNAVDLKKFAPAGEADPELRSSLGLDDAFVLGFIGSFYGYEGLSLLIDALPGIIERIPNTKLLLTGGGREEANLRAQIASLGLDDRVVLTGRVKPAEVTRYYDLVDLLVYPRISMRLTDVVTPLKPLEAMAQKRMFLASDVGGHHELIKDGVTGYLFKAGDKDALIEGVLRAHGDQTSWERMGQAGREFVEAERNWTAVVTRYEKVYEDLLA